MAVNRDTTSPFDVLSTCLFICLWVIAAAWHDVCGVRACASNIGCIAIHYSAPLARLSKRAAALPLTGQPGIHESLNILSSLSLCLSSLFPVTALCLFLLSSSVCFSAWFVIQACQPLQLSPLRLLLLLLLVFFFKLPPSSFLYIFPNFPSTRTAWKG